MNQLHQLFGFAKPKHPLISIIDTKDLVITKDQVGTRLMNELYMISSKDKSCGVAYGRNHFDFDEGVLVFSEPKQITTITQEIKKNEIIGWSIDFHPDLIHGSQLGENIEDYGYFNYEVFEVLHLSEDEEKLITNSLQSIQLEYQQRIDNHSQRVIVSNLELLLNYCLRYFEKQFNTRSKQDKSILTKFNKEL